MNTYIKTLQHPGTILGKNELTSLPYKTIGIEQLIQESKKWLKCGALSCIDIGPHGSGVGHKEITEDSMQCYRFTLLWLATKDISHAASALSILKEWAYKCKEVKGCNAPLECAWAGCAFVRSAELLRHTSKVMDENSIKQIDNFFYNMILPNLLNRYKEIKKWNNNWILTIIEALIQMYIYKNDVAMVLYYINEYLEVAPKMFIGQTGKNTECERDIIHATFQLASHIQICEMVYHQGVDLYSEILCRSCEYIASIINGKVPADIKKENIKDAWFMPGPWNIAYNHYVKRKKEVMKETEKMLNSDIQKRLKFPEGMSFNWGPGWTHRLTD